MPRGQEGEIPAVVYVSYVENHTLPVLFLRTSYDSGDTFGDPIVAGNPGLSWTPTQMASSTDKVYIVWCGGPGRPDIDVFFRRAYNYGATLDPVINLSNVGIQVLDLKVAAYGDDVYVVWGGRDYLIYFVASHDAGQTFTNPVKLSPTADSWRPQMAISGDYVYVTWVTADDLELNPQDIYFTVSRDGGMQFAMPQNLSQNPGGTQINAFDYISDFPDIAARGEHAFVVWSRSYDPNQAGFNAPGDVFLTHIQELVIKTKHKISSMQDDQDFPSDADAWHAKVAAHGSTVSVVWTRALNDGTYDLYYTSGNAHGTQPFEKPVKLGQIYPWSEDANLPGVTSPDGVVRPVYVTWDSPFGDAFFIRNG